MGQKKSGVTMAEEPNTGGDQFPVGVATVSPPPRGWWRYYPRPSRSPRVNEPPQDFHPVLQVGDLVRLKGKPEVVRRVLGIEWHCYRYEYVYIVETSASRFYYEAEARSHNPSWPYWFAPQLLAEPTPYGTVNPTSPKPIS